MNPIRLLFYRLVTSWLPESRGFSWKRMWLRFAGAKVGRNVRIYSSARFWGNGNLVIGDDVHIGSEVMIYLVSPAGISIGNCVDIGPRVTILTGSHEIDREGAHIAGRGVAKSVMISDGCWLGARSVVLPGVILATKTLVAAGAVVTRSIAEPKLLVAGVPAVVKKNLD